MEEGEESSWELIWPPSLTSDEELIDIVCAIIGDHRRFPFHESAWRSLHDPKMGLNGSESLVDELITRSGAVSTPFLVQCMDDIFSASNMGTDCLAAEIRCVLQHPLPPSSECDEEEHEIKAIELYQGVVWELSCMLACHVVSISMGDADFRPPASCLEPVDREQFLRTHIDNS